MESERVIEQHIVALRNQLMKTVSNNVDATSNIVPLLHIRCPLHKKYELLDITGLIQNNNQSMEQLKQIGLALCILEKYGRHLMKEQGNRSELWRFVKFSNPIFKERVDAIKGGRDIMRQMGYCNDIQDGLAFPEDTEPEPDKLLRLVTDILLGRKELEVFLQGCHPRPDVIESLLTQPIVNNLKSTWSSMSTSPSLPQNSTVSQSVPPVSSQQRATSLVCDICGHESPEYVCNICDNKQLCKGCDEKWHQHPKRQQHSRKNIKQNAGEQSKSGQQVGTSTNDSKMPVGMTVSQYGYGHGQVTPAPTFPPHLTPTPYSTSSSPPDARVEPHVQSPLMPPIYQQPPYLNGKPITQKDLRSVPSHSQYTAHQDPGNLPVPKGITEVMKSDSDESFHSADDTMETSALCSQQAGHAQNPVSYPPTSSQTGRESNPQASLNPPGSTSKLLPKILAIQDPAKRKAKMEINIITLNEEMEEMESRINFIIANNEKFYDDSEYKTLARKKGTLLREKYALEQCFKQHTKEESEVIGSRERKSNNHKYEKHILSQLPQFIQATAGDGDVNNVFQQLPPPDVSSPRQSLTVGPDVIPEEEKRRVTMQYGDNSKEYELLKEMNSKMKFPPTVSNLVVGGQLPGMKPLGVAAPQGESVRDIWVCQLCTYHNKLDTRVCNMCNKTTGYPEIDIEQTYKQVAMEVATAPMKQSLIVGDQDKVFLEKQEAHKKYQKMLKEQREQKQTFHHSPVFSEKPPTQFVQEYEGHKFVPSVSPNNQSEIPAARNERASPETGGVKQVLGRRQAMEHTLSSESFKTSPPFSGEFPYNCDSKEFEDSLDRINHRRHIEQLNLEGSKLVSLIKNAEKEGFDVADVEMALLLAQGEDTSAFLHHRWVKIIERVVTLATDEGKKMAQNDVGQISKKEAKTALIESKGDVNAAVEFCVNKRKEQFSELASCGNFAREDILHSLFEYQDVDLSLDHLNNTVLQQYLDRIWVQEDEWKRQSEALYEVEIQTMQAVSNDNYNSISNSVVKYEDFQRVVKNQNIDASRRIRMILVEGKLQSWGRAATVIKILDNDLNKDDYPECTLEDVIEAVRNCTGDKAAALVYLSEECMTCYSKFPKSKIRSLGTCTCKLCIGCMKSYFLIAIREKFVREWSCPICNLPDLDDEKKSDGYLPFLTLLLPTLLEPDIIELFLERLKDWHLQRDPKFRWCEQCGNGFLWEAGERNLAMTCPHCKKKTCFKCKKQWDAHHDGLTCEEYDQWRIDNDPDNQAHGLARHLEANGIDCPKCKRRYDKTKGGCIHFSCPECRHEFCSGCFNQFYHNNKHSVHCKQNGLHCHHPRDCFYYLRDNNIDQLKRLLVDQNVTFNEIEPEHQEDKKHCPVMEQKDLGQKEEACNKDVEVGCAGLCSNHYKEYLVGLINKHKVDPASILTNAELKICLTRHDVPTKHTDRPTLLELVKSKCPLITKR